MTQRDWMNEEHAAIFTDLYQLTMLQAYFREGMNKEAVFSLFSRQMPERNYLIAAGLGTILGYLEDLRFSQQSLDFVASQGQFTDEFIEYLAEFRFTGNVYAVQEGTPVFPDEPLLEVEAPIGEAQLIETFVLNQITFQTGIATKAHRVVRAAAGATVADFGMRRMHGADAALKGARAMHIAGVHATSNVLAGQFYDMPITGTMAHSYIQAHPSEMDAFREFASIYPDTTLLVDTYDTLAGIRQVIRLAEELGDDFAVGAVRLDSGDLGELATKSRKLLDDAGLEDVEIFASGSLDEHRIEELLGGSAPIDGFGVGTRMGTMSDKPYLDTAYKLTRYADDPRMKLSPAKANLPGRKQVFRFLDEGEMTHDIIGTAEEEFKGGEPLLECVMRGGKRTDEGQRSLDDIRQHAQAALGRLPDRLLQLDEADTPYPVELSSDLQERRNTTREELEARVAEQHG